MRNYYLEQVKLCNYLKENIMNAYKVAQENNYRFFSFGDAMFIK